MTKTLNIAREHATLRGMSVKQLRARYRDLFGEETRSQHKDFLVRRILWRMQAKAYGGLSERARRRAEELADDADLRVRAPSLAFNPASAPITDLTVTSAFTQVDDRLPPPGSELNRMYKGRLLTVLVREKGFEYEGNIYRSLTAIAKKVTGSHWNGYDFFNIAGGKRGDT